MLLCIAARAADVAGDWRDDEDLEVTLLIYHFLQKVKRVLKRALRRNNQCTLDVVSVLNLKASLKAL